MSLHWHTRPHEQHRQATHRSRPNPSSLVLNATLTLLGFLIAFSFSMAINRYEQRKNFEEAEANAIGTANVRAGLLPSADAVNVRELLRRHLNQRKLFYTTRNERQLRQIAAQTTQLQSELWSRDPLETGAGRNG